MNSLNSHEDENKVLKFENISLLQANDDHLSDNKIAKDLNLIISYI